MSYVTRRETGLVLVAINAVFAERFPLPAGSSKADQERKATMVDVWHTLLKDLPEGLALAATQSVLMEAAHPPRPGEIRKRALASKLETASGADAWGEVCKAIGRWGRNRFEEASQHFSTPAIVSSVQAIGGWIAICNSDNTVADRARFIEHFENNMSAAKQRVLAGAATSIEGALSERQKRIEAPSFALRLVGGDKP